MRSGIEGSPQRREYATNEGCGDVQWTRPAVGPGRCRRWPPEDVVTPEYATVRVGGAAMTGDAQKTRPPEDETTPDNVNVVTPKMW